MASAKKMLMVWNGCQRKKGLQELPAESEVNPKSKPEASFDAIYQLWTNFLTNTNGLSWSFTPLQRTSAGNRYILVVADYCTRFPEGFPLKKMDTQHRPSYSH